MTKSLTGAALDLGVYLLVKDCFFNNVLLPPIGRIITDDKGKSRRDMS